jgi:hypothetical protein
MHIEEIPNDEFPKIDPVKEVMDIYIPNVIEGIPNRNGFIWVMSGSGGSGKTSLMLNFFRQRKLYRGKFDNIYYICPESSFTSVKDHPFEKHDKVFHELTPNLLLDLYSELNGFKEEYTQKMENKKNKKNKKKGDTGFEDEIIEEDDEEPELKYNCVIIDDMADALKNNEIQKVLNKMLIKARHICTAFIFTLQSYYYFPKMLRKQITNITIFKPKNAEEWSSITKELLNMNQDDGLEIYDYVFSEPYAHLDLDTVSNRVFKNFNELIIKKNNSSL